MRSVAYMEYQSDYFEVEGAGTHGALAPFRTVCDYPSTKGCRGSGLVPRTRRVGLTPNESKEIVNKYSKSAPRDQAVAVLTALAFQRSVSDDPYINGTIVEPLLFFKDADTLEVSLHHPHEMGLDDPEMGLESFKCEPCGSEKDRCYILGECANTYGMKIFFDPAKVTTEENRLLMPPNAAAPGVAAPVQYVYYQEAFTIFVHTIPPSAMFQPSLSWREGLKHDRLTVGLALDEARLVTTYDDMTESSTRKEVHSGQWIGASSFTNIVLPEGPSTYILVTKRL